jgi:hypothetical protein
MNLRTIVLTSNSTRPDVSAVWLTQVAADITIQLIRDVCPDLGLTSTWSVTTDVTAEGYELRVSDVSPVPGAAGYHDNDDPEHAPEAFAFDEGGSLDDLSVTISHETIELIKDQDASGFRVRQSDFVAFADEECDAVEDQTYRVNSTLVSDYVLDSWYVEGSDGPWDKLGVLTGPHTKTAGGYWIEMTGGTVSTDPPEAARKSRKKAHPLSRTSRRLARCPNPVTKP